MIGRLMVPVAGTIAALIAIALAREPRGPAPEPPPFDWPDVPEHGEPDEPLPPEEENPDARTYRLELAPDGALTDLDEKNRFASLEEFVAQAPGAGHTIVLSKGKGTAEAAFLDAMRKLEETKRSDGTPRFLVHPAQPAESRTFQIELQADGTLRDLQAGTAFATAAELVEQLGEARHTLVISNGKDVTEADLDALLSKLRDEKLEDGDPRFLVRKVYRAAEAPSGD